MESLLDPDSESNQWLMFIIGVGTVWAFLAIAAFWLLGYHPSPHGFATALAHTAVPTLVTVGGHEAAHYVVADEYCGYDDVDFSAFYSTRDLTIASFIGASVLVVVDVLGVVSVPKWVILFGVVSPGAVVARGSSVVSKCMDETALAGPLFNFSVGILLLGLLGGVPFPTAHLDLVAAWIAYTVPLSLYFALFNALPLPRLDGSHVVKAGEPATIGLLAIIILSSGWILFTPG